MQVLKAYDAAVSRLTWLGSFANGTDRGHLISQLRARQSELGPDWFHQCVWQPIIAIETFEAARADFQARLDETEALKTGAEEALAKLDEKLSAMPTTRLMVPGDAGVEMIRYHARDARGRLAQTSADLDVLHIRDRTDEEIKALIDQARCGLRHYAPVALGLHALRVTESLTPRVNELGQAAAHIAHTLGQFDQLVERAQREAADAFPAPGIEYTPRRTLGALLYERIAFREPDPVPELREPATA